MVNRGKIPVERVTASDDGDSVMGKHRLDDTGQVTEEGIDSRVIHDPPRHIEAGRGEIRSGV